MKIYNCNSNNLTHIFRSPAKLGMLTLGLAVSICAIGRFIGKMMFWIKQGKGTTKKTQDCANLKFSNLSPDSNKSTLKIGSHSSGTSLTITSPIKPESISLTFTSFVSELEQDILPIYEKHEKGFDTPRIHSRLHVTRAVLFAEIMARYYQSQGENIDFDYVRRVTGMHDAGREGNGIDLWEKESAELLAQHLIAKGSSAADAQIKSSIIIKDKSHEDSIHYKIFQSADCLDIMRPCTGQGGRNGFNPKFLTFLNKADGEALQFRNQLIEEAWIFIKMTEKQKMTIFDKSEGLVKALLNCIEANKEQFKILSILLKKQLVKKIA